MNLESKQMAEKPKKVGTLRGRPIYQLKTKGGLYLVVSPHGTGFETLGTGPHRAVAQYVAQKHEPDIFWSELNKGEHLDPDSFSLILPKYEAITDALRALGGK